MNKYLEELATVEAKITETLSYEDGIKFATIEDQLDKSITDCANLLSAYAIGYDQEDSATTEALAILLTAPAESVQVFTSLESGDFLKKAIQAVKDTLTKLIDWVKKIYSKVFNKKIEEVKVALKKTGPVKVKVDAAVIKPIDDVKKLSESERTMNINGEDIVLDTTKMKDVAVIAQVKFVSAFRILLGKGYIVRDVDEDAYYTINFEGEDKTFPKDDIDKEIGLEYESNASMIDEYIKWRYRFEELISNLKEALRGIEKEEDADKANKAMKKLTGFIRHYKSALKNIERVMDFETKLLKISIDAIK